MAPKTTLKDIARAVGLSESAVSQVLNDRPCRLSEESKRKIKETAQQMQYRANQVARSLATKRSYTIGLVIPDIENPFFASLAKNLEDHCRRSGYGLFIANSNDCMQRDCEQLARLDDRGVDGIAYVASSDPSSHDESLRLKTLSTLSVPYVMVDRTLEAAQCDKVCIDNELGAYRATRYVLDHGHTRIGCLVNTRFSQNGNMRYEGYCRALEERGILVEDSFVAPCEYHRESGYEAVDRLLDAGVTAIFSTSDFITAGVLLRLRERGIAVPDDMSLMSFDHNEAFSFMWPGLASVDQNIPQLTSEVFRMLTRRIDGYKGESETKVVEPTLVPGESVASR